MRRVAVFAAVALLVGLPGWAAQAPDGVQNGAPTALCLSPDDEPDEDPEESPGPHGTLPDGERDLPIPSPPSTAPSSPEDDDLPAEPAAVERPLARAAPLRTGR
jgi:hypothetical protein